MGSTRSRWTTRRRRRPALLTGLLRIALGAAVLLAGVVTVAMVDANWRFSRLQTSASTRVLSAPFELRHGLSLDQRDLTERLRRLGYQAVKTQPTRPGEYSRRFRSVDIYLNAFEYPDGPAPPKLVRVRLRFGRISRIGVIPLASFR